jgi:hypothetical protein
MHRDSNASRKWEASMAGFCGDIWIVRRFDRILEDITSSGSLSGAAQVWRGPRGRDCGASLSGVGAILQLTDARSASVRPATDVIDESLIEAVDAIGRTLEGRTVKQKNPHPCGSLSWLYRITGRLGGWHGYYKPPGPKTMADGWRRLAAMLDGCAIAHVSGPKCQPSIRLHTRGPRAAVRGGALPHRAGRSASPEKTRAARFPA